MSELLRLGVRGLQLLNGDRIKNIRYVFRHAEAAGIMIVLANQSYVGHTEHAWNSVWKVTLGIMHITQDVRSISLSCHSIV